MRTVSDEYLTQVQGSGRQFGVMVKVYGNGAEPESLWLGDIISIDILRSCSDQLQIGACMSDMLTLETKATTLFNGRLKKVEVFYRCTAPVLDWIQLGTFYVDEAVTRNGVTAVKAYDMMSRLDKRVSWVDTSKATAPTFPCKMQAMLNYLCARAGVTTDFVCEDITVEKAPDGYTAQELISYIAASHGRNARFSPSEVLKFPAYEEVGKTVQHGRCYSLDIAGGSGYTVKGILLQRGGDDKIYIDGTASEYDETADGIVTAYDPFATVGIAEYTWNRLGGLNYSAVSLEMPAENILEPGDVFTVEDADGTQKKVIVMEQELSLTCTGGFVEKISCTAESKAQNRSTENRQEATEKQVAAGATSAALTEYQYLTDTSVKFNGVTYTVEKDAETGLISKISDSNGNEFEPEISAGITDVAAHNAVFWAVAMCRGISKTAFIMDGIFGMFTPDTRDIANSRWRNSVSGYNDITLSGGSENGSALRFNPGEYGSLICDEPNTVYAILRADYKSAGGMTWFPLITKHLSIDSKYYGFDIFSLFGQESDYNTIAFSAVARDIPSSVDSSGFHIVCYTRDSGKILLYIDSVLVGAQNRIYTGNYGGNMLLNFSNRGGRIPENHELTSTDIVLCAFGSQYHDAATVQKNTAYLMKKYNVGGNT
jgi:hypothetical protein